MLTYKPLNRESHEIRLLRFVDFTHDPNELQENISIEMRHASLSDGTSYAAISYTWGDITDKVKIDINKDEFYITKNLHVALQQLRRDGVDSWFWVDAICIEQLNNAEKSWHVELMKDVFSRATHVHLWLGPGCPKSDLAMDFIAQIGNRAEAANAMKHVLTHRTRRELVSCIERIARDESIDVEHNEIYDLARLMYDLLNTEALRERSDLILGIKDILQREYWHRIWVIQEVALAKQAYVIVGRKRTSIESFDACFATIWEASRLDLQRGFPQWDDFCLDLSGTLYTTKPIQVRRDIHYEGREMPLCRILWEDRINPGRPFYTATDPRDLVFGLLGVISNTESKYIQVDYNKSIVDVFAIAARISLYSRHLELNRCVPGNINGPLPTWVPDWQDVGNSGVTTYSINHVSGHNATPEKHRQHYTPGANMSDEILRQLGCRVEEIMEVMEAPEWFQSDPSMASFLKNPDDWFRSIQNFMGPEPDKKEDHVLDIFLNLGSPDFGCPVHQETKALFRSAIRVENIEAAALTEKQKLVGLKRLISSGQDIGDEHLVYLFRGWRHSWSASYRNRTLFKTAEGRLGLGHVGIVAGDLVTLIWDVSVPIVLRPRDDGGFYFRGDAYVCGIMQGEFFDAEDWVEEEFHIH